MALYRYLAISLYMERRAGGGGSDRSKVKGHVRVAYSRGESALLIILYYTILCLY